MLAPGQQLTTDELQAFMARRVAKFKVPQHVWFRDEVLPRNASGKFLKRQVKAELLDG